MHGFTSHINFSPLQIKRFSVFFFSLSKQEIKSLMLIVCSCLPSANSPLLNFSLQTSNELGERDYKANPVKKKNNNCIQSHLATSNIYFSEVIKSFQLLSGKK